ncbi:MAG: hypothetical protein KC636_29135 [Myxococcales bacterium]|nr:hypothetical protein [Myxococcales bacterium]
MPRLTRSLALTLTLTGACSPEPSTSTETDATTGTDTTTETAEPTTTAPSTTEPATTAGTDTAGSSTASSSDATDSDPSETDPSATDPSDTDPNPWMPECQADSDCQLVNNCCECSAHPAGDTIEPCDEQCDQPSCEAIGILEPTASCGIGVCRLGPAPCNVEDVACDTPPPECPGDEDRVPSVVDGCWGPCVPAFFCDALPDCADRCPSGMACVHDMFGGTPPHCEPLPEPCGVEPTCECVDPWLFDVCPGEGCLEQDGALVCFFFE